MKRSKFVAGLLGGSTLASSRAAAQTRAQVGWLSVAPHPGIDGFREGMRALADPPGGPTLRPALGSGQSTTG
ncbi:MAG: hypothetical protein ABW003_16715 [Microvirga sp.]